MGFVWLPGKGMQRMPTSAYLSMGYRPKATLWGVAYDGTIGVFPQNILGFLLKGASYE
jgi:hypothetical protein